MRSCNGFTCLHLDKVSFGFGKKIYQNGIKYCSTCSRFLKIDGYKCPCCKSNVRSKSHTKKYRENILHNASSNLTENINSIEKFRGIRKV